MEALAGEIGLIVRHHVMPLHRVVFIVQIDNALRHAVVNELASRWEEAKYFAVVPPGVVHTAAGIVRTLRADSGSASERRTVASASSFT